jgi:hypothetical protein
MQDPESFPGSQSQARSCSHEDSDIEARWPHLDRMRLFARALRKAGAATHCGALEAVSCSLGYASYNEAVHIPRAICISLEHWRASLLEHLALQTDPLAEGTKLEIWFDRLLVRALPPGMRVDCAQGRLPKIANPRAVRDVEPELSWEDEPESFDERVPAHVTHESTIVDTIAAKPRRARRRTGPGEYDPSL